MSSKKASLINFRQAQRPSSAPNPDAFVNEDPLIPTPSLPESQIARIPESQTSGKPESQTTGRIKATFRLQKQVHKALKLRAGNVEKSLEDLVEDALESYLDKNWPEWRTFTS